jgi:hypothetical protein
MVRTVWKFSMPSRGPIRMPKGAEILAVQTQHNEPQLWAKVDPHAELEDRYFEVVGTGHPIIEPKAQYVGTFQLSSGDLVFHVFEVEG